MLELFGGFFGFVLTAVIALSSAYLAFHAGRSSRGGDIAKEAQSLQQSLAQAKADKAEYAARYKEAVARSEQLAQSSLHGREEWTRRQAELEQQIAALQQTKSSHEQASSDHQDQLLALEHSANERYRELQSALNEEIELLSVELEQAHEKQVIAAQEASQYLRQAEILEDQLQHEKAEVQRLRTEAESAKSSSPSDEITKLRHEITRLQRELNAARDMLSKERSQSRMSVYELMKEIDTEPHASSSSLRVSSRVARNRRMASTQKLNDSEHPHIGEARQSRASMVHLPEPIPRGKPAQEAPQAPPLTIPENPAEEQPIIVDENGDVVEQSLQNQLSAKKSAMTKHRSAVVQEIFTSEKSYLKVLTILCGDLLNPLEHAVRVGRPIISESDIRTIFSCVGVIRNYNKFFMERLAPRIENWEQEQQIGDIFLEMSLWLKSYSAYINNYQNANDTFLFLKENNENFAQFVSHALEPHEYSDLTFLLIAPVQRLPRYVLLLKDLVANTYPEHQDYEDLQEALRRIEAVADDINEAKADLKDTEQVLEVAARFDQEFHSIIVTPYRKFTRDLFMFTSQVDPAVSPSSIPLKDIFIVILFTDILVLAQPRMHPFCKDRNLSRPSLVSRQDVEEKRSCTVFNTVERDLDFRESYQVDRLSLQEASGDDKALYINFPKSSGEGYNKILLHTESSQVKDAFMKDFDHNRSELLKNATSAHNLRSVASKPMMPSASESPAPENHPRKRNFFRRLVSQQRLRAN